MGPLFAAVVARALDRWWEDLGRPDPFVVVEAGAGAGTLARDVLDAGPHCAPALRYVLVERSERLRAEQGGRLSLELPAGVLGPGQGDDGDDDEGSARLGVTAGPLVTSLADLPAQAVTGVVLANELLDNLPFHLLERSPAGWDEILVGSGPVGLVEVAVPAHPERAAEASRLAPDASPGGRVPLQHGARSWLGRALSLVQRGRVVVIDYADATPSMAARPWLHWVRTYRGHGPGGHPLDRPGTQDVTCEVAVDQLARLRPPSSDRSQADFLAEHGIHELVATARAAWEAGAAAGHLEAVRNRSRVAEGAALMDRSGLGGFRVLEWVVEGEADRRRARLRP